MSSDTTCSNWGAMSIASANAGLGIGERGTLYVFRNFDNGDRFLFGLIDLGFGMSFGFRLNQAVRALGKSLISDKNLENPASYTKVPVTNAFSASDLSFSPGAESTVGVVVLAASCSETLISAWPFFQGAPKPGQEVNNDYFTGVRMASTTDIGLQATAAYQFVGRWLKLWSF